MGILLKENELNPLKKGTALFNKGEPIRFFGVIAKGSIRIQNGAVCRLAKKGSILAVADLFFDQYLADYIVEEDAIFYAFGASGSASLQEFLEKNKEYRGIIVHSMEEELEEALKERQPVLTYAKELFAYIKQHYAWALGEGMEEDEVPKQFLSREPEHAFPLQCGQAKVSYYIESLKTPLSLHKKFYYSSSIMAFYQAGELSQVIRDAMESHQALLDYFDVIYDKLWNKMGDNLFDKEVRFLKEMRNNGTFKPEHLERLKETNGKIYELHQVILQNTGKDLPFDQQYLKDMLASVLSGNAAAEAGLKPEEDPMSMLGNSLAQILKYGKIPVERQKEITEEINAFVHAKDRLSTQDDMRRIKKQLTSDYFEVYKGCIFQWFKSETAPLAVRLFLNYGYMDERLLEEKQILFLCEMLYTRYNGLPCRIYTMPEWLKAVYDGKKEPSRNSFEQDYRDYLRAEKRSGNITEKQEAEFLNDSNRRVLFEIDSMFANNNKIVNGKLSTYVPILYSDEIYGNLERLFLTPKQLCDAIIELEQKDFTVFQREVLYTNPELKIEKEHVIKRVYPDVIMAPVYGTASSMWQEITGKKRDSPGRFIFPVISENEVDKLVTKAFGRFHWEYCRCEQGASWNNIQYKSLTSEYMDYIQYYRKNHELSEDKREKIKTQILRARNNSREIFLSDYEMWIYSESKSAMKLNKVSRSILATYCPFNKEIRESLKTNVTFAEAMMRQQRTFGERTREWDMRIKRRENNGLEVPQEFYDTYDYYAKS